MATLLSRPGFWQLVIEDGRWKISAIDEEALNQVFGMPEAEPAP